MASVTHQRALGLCHEPHVQNSGWTCDFIDLGSGVAGSHGGATVGPASTWIPTFLGVGRPGLAAPRWWGAMPGSLHEPRASLGECLLESLTRESCHLGFVGEL